jgi:hypothetical protein
LRDQFRRQNKIEVGGSHRAGFYQGKSTGTTKGAFRVPNWWYSARFVPQ